MIDMRSMDDFISTMGCWYFSNEWDTMDVEVLCKIIPQKSFDLLLKKKAEVAYNDQTNFALCVLGMFLIKWSGVSLDE